ncbi:TIR domain-containing protein [Anoxybacillus sp. FSL W8-1294]|uniref:TIR domain-containing protein n=1 Tax=Anoxybacillus sp. FSL W8-1294 TaxID=2954655 RepID=UPI0030CD505C
MSLYSLQNQILQSKKKLTDLKIKLQKQKDTELKIRKEIQRIEKTLSRSTGSSITTKLRNIQRQEQKLDAALKEQSNLMKKINDEEKKLRRLEEQLIREQKKEADKLTKSLEHRIHTDALDQIQLQLEQLKQQAAQSLEIDNKKENIIYDVFISHAHEDKEAIVTELSQKLSRAGLRVFEDVKVINLGDSLSDKINEGIKYSKLGIVVLSKAFFRKGWTQYEYKGFLHREIEEGRTVILPIWHGVTKEEVAQFNPVLVDKMAVKTEEHSIDEIVDMILRVVPSQ